MDTTPGDKNTPKQSPTIMIKLGSITLAGRAAAGFLIAILALIVALIAYFKPWINPSPLWLSGLLWILFIVYWNAAAKNSAPAKSSESQASRNFHQNLLSAAYLLLFIPIPGLSRRFLPTASWIVPTGIALHICFLLLAVWARRRLGSNWSGAVTAKVDHQLIRSGPYRIVRHPIYSA